MHNIDVLNMLTRVFVSCAVISIGILIASWDKYLLEYLGELKLLKQDVTLAVCILSAQNHFKHREAIRNSWMTDIQEIRKSGKQVVAKFAVGRESCHIHPANRLDPHDCKRWEPSLPENHQELRAFNLAPHTMETSANVSVITHHLYVKVMTDIVLRRLGLVEQLGKLTSQQNKTARVVLYDAATDEEITHAEFSSSRSSVDVNGYEYRPVEEFLLPKLLAACILSSRRRNGYDFLGCIIYNSYNNYSNHRDKQYQDHKTI